MNYIERLKEISTKKTLSTGDLITFVDALPMVIELVEAAEKLISHKLVPNLDSPEYATTPGSLWTLYKNVRDALSKLKGDV